jgi:hypothetical protein
MEHCEWMQAVLLDPVLPSLERLLNRIRLHLFHIQILIVTGIYKYFCNNSTLTLHFGVLDSNVAWFFTQPLLLLLLGVVAQADTPSIAAGMGALGKEMPRYIAIFWS